MEDNIKVCVIVGPTCTEKSKTAVILAKKIEAEIISFDSMQIYKDMNIVTAKTTKKEQDGVIHHMVDIFELDKEFSVAEYVELAKKTILKIIEKGKKAILVGGTGLYIDSLLCGRNFQKEDETKKIRKELEEKTKIKGIEYIYNKLKIIDPNYAKKIHINNKKKIIRAMEIFLNTGKTMSENIILNNKAKAIFTPLKIGLNFKDREKLYKKIDIRVDKMVEKGLLNEAKYIFSKKCSKTAMQAIGYKELIPYFDGKINFKEAISKIKQNTRRYAKRQICWFKRDLDINWFYLDEKNYYEILEEIFYIVNKFF